jgi:hypothetical protein
MPTTYVLIEKNANDINYYVFDDDTELVVLLNLKLFDIIEYYSNHDEIKKQFDAYYLGIDYTRVIKKNNDNYLIQYFIDNYKEKMLLEKGYYPMINITQDVWKSENPHEELNWDYVILKVNHE